MTATILCADVHEHGVFGAFGTARNVVYVLPRYEKIRRRATLMQM